MKKLNILDIMINDCSLDELLKKVSTALYNKKKTIIMYANIHVVNTAQYDVTLKKALSETDIIYCDGEGVRLGAKILGEKIPERMTGADWIYNLCSVVEKTGHSIFLLGSTDGTALKVKEILKRNYNKLNIAGLHHGYFNHEGPENERVISSINNSKTDILLVGFGTPLQEKWIKKNKDKLDVTIIWAVGAVMDFVSEFSPRAPKILRDNGMEWLYRLYNEPKRMWRRYLLGNLSFIYKIFKMWLKTCRDDSL